MKELIYIGAELDKLFALHRWKYCIIGGVALQRWGQSRLTLNLDLILLTGLKNEKTYIDELLRHYEGRVINPKEFALEHRVLLLKTTNGIGIDIALGGFPYEETVIGRASRFEFIAGIFLLTCSAEDLIILKAFADRGQDWIDVEGILIRQQNRLDWDYIYQQLPPLCELKETPEIVERLTQLREKTSK